MTSRILFLGTDGIWERENEQGEMFGIDRLRTVIRLHCHESPEAIAAVVIETLSAFRRTKPREDDVTVVIVKAVVSKRAL